MIKPICEKGKINIFCISNCKTRDDNKLNNLRYCPELVQEAIEELEIKIESLGQSMEQPKQLKRKKRLTWL